MDNSNDEFQGIEIGDGSWRDQAMCRGTDTNVFFPTRAEKGTGKRLYHSKAAAHLSNPDLESNKLSRARMLCVQCNVRKECLQYAIANNIKHGIYGGKTGHDRRDISLTDLQVGIPFRTFLKDLRRVRRVDDRECTSLVNDIARTLGVSTGAAEKLLRKSDHDTTLV